MFHVPSPLRQAYSTAWIAASFGKLQRYTAAARLCVQENVNFLDERVRSFHVETMSSLQTLSGNNGS
jgi:hypothetical protein